METLEKRIIIKAQPLFNTLRGIGISIEPMQTYRHLARAAIALAEKEDAKDIESEASKTFNRWLLNDVREDVRHFIRERNSTGNRKVPVHDWTTLPWGAQVHQVVQSGIVNDSLAVIIEPVSADASIENIDNARKLMDILEYVATNWGIIATCWFLADKDTCITEELDRLEIPKDKRQQEYVKIKRIVNRITRDVQERFKD